MIYPVRIFLIFLLLVIFCTKCLSQDVVCRNERIEGFDNEFNYALHVFPSDKLKTTDDIKKSSIYITFKDNTLYVQSNFQNFGADHPTKIATAQNLSLKEIATNIYFTEPPSSNEYEEMINSLQKDVDIIIDVRLLNNNTFSNLDFSFCENVSFAFPPDTRRQAINVINKQGDKEYLLKYKDRIFTRINNQNLNFVYSSLASKSIQSQNLKIISLIENTATKSLIEKELLNEKIPFDYSSVGDFKKLLLDNKGKRTIILGHIENAQFVTRDAGGKELFRIALNELETFQKENSLELILLGCNSGIEGSTSGSLNKFNSLDAIRRIKATKNTENVDQFLDSLSFGVFSFVVDETFFSHSMGDNLVFNNLNTELPEKVKINVFENDETNAPVFNSENIGTITLLGFATSEIVSQNLQQQSKDSSSKNVDTTTVSSEDTTTLPPQTEPSLMFGYIVLGVIGVGILIYLLAKK